MVPAAKTKDKGKYLPKDVAAIGMLLLTGLLIMYTGALAPLPQVITAFRGFCTSVSAG